MIKLVLFSLLAVSILGVGQVYADWEEFNHVVDNRSEAIFISGITQNPSESVNIQIFDKDDILIVDHNWTSDNESEFGINYGDSDLNGFGQYRAIVIYDGIDTEFDFELIGRHAAAGIPPEDMMTDQKDQDIERLQLEIQKRDSRISELKNQVFDLQRELDNLQAIVNEQIRVMLTYFS